MNIWAILEIVLPVIAIVGVGSLSIHLGWLPKSAVPGLGTFVTTIALPFALFCAIAPLDLRAVFDWRLVITFATVGLLMVIVSMVFASRMLGFDLSRSAIAGMGGATCNGVMFGLPILSQAYGEIGIVSVSVLFMAQALCIVPFILISAEMGQSDETSLQRIVQKTAKTTLKNPIIIAITLGICVALLEIKLPIVVSKATSMLGVAGPGIALFFIGAVLYSTRPSGKGSVVIGVSTLKVIVHPSLMFLGLKSTQAMSAIFGWPEINPALLGAIFVLSTMPMLGLFVPLAAKYGIAKEAASAALSTTMLSALTMSTALWLTFNVGLF